MARFKYMGEPKGFMSGVVVKWGPTIEFKLRKKNGTLQSFKPVPPATEFVIGKDIGYDITDERQIRYMRADVRFEEII